MAGRMRLRDAPNTWLNTVFWVLLVGIVTVCFVPRVPNLLMLAACAVVFAVTITFIWISRHSPRLVTPTDGNDAFYIFITFAPLALALRSLLRFELVDWEWPFAVASLIGFPLSLAVTFSLRDKKTSLPRVIFLAIFTCFTGPGSLVWSMQLFANALGVERTAVVYRAQVAERHEQRSKSTMYWVVLSDPPALNGITHFRMSSREYEQIGLGDYACIDVFEGQLSIRWYHTAKCPD